MATEARRVACCAGNFFLASFAFAPSMGQWQLVKITPQKTFVAWYLLHGKSLKTDYGFALYTILIWILALSKILSLSAIFVSLEPSENQQSCILSRI